LDEKQVDVFDQATAARTIAELQEEIATLARLKATAHRVRSMGEDTKWCELSALLQEKIFTSAIIANKVSEESIPYGAGSIPGIVPSPSHKLIVFTEFRDTLNYLRERVSTLLGSQEAVVCIHGSMGREERRKMQERFLHDPDVRVLLATDAAGEGINLHRAHLMINYDLPWNPNRLEQRFGRIHRIGQTEVCHLWNLVAHETREGDVYYTLLEKIEEAREALSGQVFDVLGQLEFEGKPLRQLLIEAIRYGEEPEVRERLSRVVADAVNQPHLQELMENRALVQDIMDASRITKVRENMERAEARRLQPHYIESFFLKAFELLGGSIRERESRRYQATHIPTIIRNRDRQIGRGNPVLARYERIAFEKDLVALQGQPLADFVCPGHPLLDATVDLILERYQSLFKQGAVLVDEQDESTMPRVLYYLEHSIQDETVLPNGGNRAISKQMLYLERDSNNNISHLHYAPYLDYRPLKAEEPTMEAILQRPEANWIAISNADEIERAIMSYAITDVVQKHLEEVKTRRDEWIAKTRAAVKDRLTKEIAHWDHRAEQLKIQEEAGKVNAKLNSQEARRRAEELRSRLQSRMTQLDLEEQIKPKPPVIVGGALIVPIGLIRQMIGNLETDNPEEQARCLQTQQAAARARTIVMQTEKELGYEPTDREHEKLGYDIESRDLQTGHLRFIEVKGRITNADTITVTKNEILYSLNKPEQYILAIVEFLEDDSHRVHYIRNPFTREPDFGVTSVNYDMKQLIEKSEVPR
jgi:hypothetical protein